MLKLKDIIDELGFEYCNIKLEDEVNSCTIDSREVVSNSLYFALKGSRFDGHKFIGDAVDKGAVCSIVEKGYDNKENYPVIICDNVETAMGKIANLWRKRSKAKVVAITGTNGKTTTKEMLAAILSKKYKIIKTSGNYNNHQGVPLTIFKIKEDTEVAIVEMGTNHKGEIKYLCEIAEPDYGIITNIGKAHLEFFKSKEGVLEAKIEMFEYLKRNSGVFFVNVDDPLLEQYDHSYSNLIKYGSQKDSDYTIDNVKVNDSGFGEFQYKTKIITLGMKGSLNSKNALSAIAIASELEVEDRLIADALSGFSLDIKRGEIRTFKDKEVLLDCYNANPSSMYEIIKDYSEYSKNYMLVLGDMLELGDTSIEEHKKLGKMLNSISFKYLILYGDEIEPAVKELKKENIIYYKFDNFSEMLEKFNELIEEVDSVLIKGSRKMRLEELIV